MFRLLASGLLTRTASRRLARFIPNPIVRTIAIAAAGYAINRVMTGPRAEGRRRRGVNAPRRRPAHLAEGVTSTA